MNGAELAPVDGVIETPTGETPQSICKSIGSKRNCNSVARHAWNWARKLFSLGHEIVMPPIAIIERIQPIYQLCNAVCQNGVPFQILIKDLTPEELANLKIGSDTSVVQAVMWRHWTPGIREGYALLMTLSARNHLKGKIVELQLGGVMAHVVVQVGENLIESVITKRRADEMKLKAGDEVSAIIKSTEVMLETSWECIPTSERISL
jgi:molybdopterin-binding protein